MSMNTTDDSDFVYTTGTDPTDQQAQADAAKRNKALRQAAVDRKQRDIGVGCMWAMPGVFLWYWGWSSAMATWGESAWGVCAVVHAWVLLRWAGARWAPWLD